MHIQSKPTVENKVIKCPFCNNGEIDVTITSEYISEHSTYAAHRRAIIPHYHPEKIQIHSKCSNCKASKTDIKEAIKRGTTKQLSHEERLKRLREAGLPARIETKH